MSDQRLRDLGVRIEDATPMHDFDDLVGRARQRVAVRRAGTIAAVVAACTAVVFGFAQMGAQKDQTSPPLTDRTQHDRVMWCPKDKSSGCVDINGWIAYQDNGIWAVDPTRPDDPDHAIQLTDQRQLDPLEWSNDGAKLLVRSWGQDGQLSVLHADGTKTLIADGGFFDGSFSPDGSRVIYTPHAGGGMGIVDSDGGTPRRLLDSDADAVYELAFSPDGEQIAYFVGGGDHSHTLRVMSSDGTDGRTLLFRPEASHIDDLDWSPDGQRLMFSFQQGEGGIWIVGVDGTGPTQVVPDGTNPAWSPDGTRISYQEGIGGGLRIAHADGTHVTEFGYGGSGPWNPLPLSQ